MLELGLGLTQYAPLAIYIFALIIAALTITYRVDIGIIFYVFCFPLQNMLFWAKKYPFGKDLNDILLASMLLGWLLRKKDDDGFKSPFQIPILILFLWTLLGLWNGTHYLGKSTVFSLGNPLFLQWKNFLIPYIFFNIVAYNIKTRKQIIWIIGAMWLAMLLLDRNVYNVLYYRDLSHYESGMTYNSVGTALSGNYLAIFLAQYSIVFVSLLLLDTYKWRKAAYALVLLGSYYCVMFLFSRGAYIATLISIFWIGLVKERKILILLLIVLGFWNFLLPNAVRERIEMTKSGEGYDNTTMERIYMWDKAKEMIAENPVTGAGFAVTTQMRIKLDDTRFKNYTWRSFHNNYLQTTVELGILGLVIFLWLYVLIFIKGWKLYREAEDGFIKGLGLGLMGCTLAILAGNLTGTTWHLFNISGYYWVLVALVVRSIENIKRASLYETASSQENSIPKVIMGKKNQILLRRMRFSKKDSAISK